MLTEPLLLILVGGFVASYVGGYAGLTIAMLLLVNLITYPLYAPLGAVGKMERRQDGRRWYLALILIVLFVAIVWFFMMGE